MKKIDFKDYWLSFVNIKPRTGYKFSDLIDVESVPEIIYTGAWANILVKAKDIAEAFKIISDGVEELNFEVIFIDKIENMSSLIEYEEVKEDVVQEARWLLKSGYVFMISDKIFPYE